MEDVIRKDAGERASAAIQDPDAMRQSFAWTDAMALLGGLLDGGLTMGYVLVDRHVANGHGDDVPMRRFGKDGRALRRFLHVIQISPPCSSTSISLPLISHSTQIGMTSLSAPTYSVMSSANLDQPSLDASP